MEAIDLEERNNSDVHALIGHRGHCDEGANHSTLLACALTCKDWLPRSLFNLYRIVYLNGDKRTTSMLDGLAERLNSISLRTYYLILHLDIKNRRGIFSVPSRLARHPEYVRHIHTMKIHDISYGAPFYSDGSSEAFRFALTTFRSVETLILDNVKFEDSLECIRVFLALPALRHLDLTNIQFLWMDNAMLPTNPGERASLQLGTLILNEMDATVAYYISTWLCDTESVSHLEFLDAMVHGDPGDIRKLQALLEEAGKSVKHVTLKLHRPAIPSSFNLSENTSLRSVFLDNFIAVCLPETLDSISSTHISVIRLTKFTLITTRDVDVLVQALSAPVCSTLPNLTELTVMVKATRGLVTALGFQTKTGVEAALNERLEQLRAIYGGRLRTGISFEEPAEERLEGRSNS